MMYWDMGYGPDMGFFLTNVPVKGVIPRCSEAITKISLSLTIISCIVATTHGFINSVWT